MGTRGSRRRDSKKPVEVDLRFKIRTPVVLRQFTGRSCNVFPRSSRSLSQTVDCTSSARGSRRLHLDSRSRGVPRIYVYFKAKAASESRRYLKLDTRLLPTGVLKHIKGHKICLGTPNMWRKCRKSKDPIDAILSNLRQPVRDIVG